MKTVPIVHIKKNAPKQKGISGEYEKISVNEIPSMIMKGEKLLNQAFHPCFIYNRYFHACQEQEACRPRQTHECVPQPHPSKFKNYKDIIFSKCFSGFVPITYRFFFMLNGRLPTSKIFNIFKASFLIMFRL